MILDSFSLKGKVAWITGASYGIGFAIATAFHEAGAKIVFNDINQELVDRGLASYKEIGIDAKGYDAATGKMLVCVNPQWFRPTDVDHLWGDPTTAKTVLGWNPQKTSYEELVKIMAKHDRELAKREKAMKAVM